MKRIGVLLWFFMLCRFIAAAAIIAQVEKTKGEQKRAKESRAPLLRINSFEVDKIVQLAVAEN